MNAKIWALVAAAMVASVTTTSSKSTKEWSQMNGHERYSYLVAYRISHKLVCRGLEGRNRAQDEQSLNQPIPYPLVLMYIGIYCRKDTGGTMLAQAAKPKLPKTVPRRQISPPVKAATAPPHQKMASVAQSKPKTVGHEPRTVGQAQVAQKPIEKRLSPESVEPQSQQTGYVVQPPVQASMAVPQQKSVEQPSPRSFEEAQAAQKPIVNEVAPESLVPESQQTAYVDQSPGFEYQLEAAGPRNDPLQELHFRRMPRRYSTALRSDECR